MIADSNSTIAWHRVQVKKNREALKALEIAQFRVGRSAAQQREAASLKRKITESERCIAAHERRTKRPLATDLQSLARMSWDGLGRLEYARIIATPAGVTPNRSIRGVGKTGLVDECRPQRNSAASPRF